MSTPTATALPLSPVQTAPAGALLAAAFQQDPLYVAVLPDEARRARVLTWLFEKVVAYSLRYGRVDTTPALEGVACWLPPGGVKLSIGRLLRSGLAATPLRMGLAAYGRFDAYMTYSERLHEHYAPAGHWYLWAVGVAPQSQGRGIGTRLMAPVLTAARAAGSPCYLETGVERNLGFYARQGFAVVAQGKVLKQDVPVWAMVRDGVGM